MRNKKVIIITILVLSMVLVSCGRLQNLDSVDTLSPIDTNTPSPDKDIKESDLPVNETYTETPTPPASNSEPSSISESPSQTPIIGAEESEMPEENECSHEYPEPLKIRNDGSPLSIEYADYLLSLDLTDISSITQAANKFNSMISDEKSINDSYFRSFYDYYYGIINRINYSGMYSNLDLYDIPKDVLSSNGLRLIDGEAGPYIHGKLDFLISFFYSYVSEGVQKYLDLEKEYQTYSGGGFIFEDALLTMSWDELSDLIVKCEDYINSYPSYEIEVEKAQRDLRGYLYIYTQCLNTLTFAYMSDETDNEFELRDSYIRFIKQYPNSKYQPIIKGYLELLNKNGFKLDNKAKEYLINSGIEVF